MWDTIKKRIVEWAKRPDLRAGFVVGSHARRHFPADDYSDLDLILYTIDPQLYQQSDDWISAIGLGPSLACIEYPRSDGAVEHQMLLDGGLIVDFSFERLDRLHAMVDTRQLDVVCTRGFMVLFDKDGLAARLPPLPEQPPPVEPPSEALYRQVVENFWLKALKTARAIRRGNLWFAKLRDRELKDSLLKMIEWHARALNGADYDTWVEGRFMAQWVDPKTWNDLQAVFGGLNADSSWQALGATLEVFQRLTREVAQHYGFTYPTTLEHQVRRWIEQLTP